MPTHCKIVRDLPVNFPVPGGGTTWDTDEHTYSATAVGVDTGNGVAGFTVGKTGTYAIHLGRYESIGTMDGGFWDTVATSAEATAALTAAQQYYAQGPSGAAREARVLLGYRLSFKSSDAADTGNIYLRGLDVDGVDRRETLEVAGANTVSSSIFYEKIISLTKDETDGFITVSDAQGGRFKMSPKQVESRFARVEFDSVPTDTKTMSVVYKKRVRDLESDGDVPQLPGVDEPLMAMALGDLYTKQRQLAKAQLKYTEGASLLEVLRNKESVQQMQSIELVPSDLGGWTRSYFGW